MDKLHREHDFVTAIWKFMKACETKQQHDYEFWQWAQDEAELLWHKYDNLTFASDWLTSYLKFLDATAK